jgi:hypothetical protein
LNSIITRSPPKSSPANVLQADPSAKFATEPKIDRGFLGNILRLTLLAPDIVEAILNGQQPVELGLPRLLEPLPLEWTEQRRALGSFPKIATPNDRVLRSSGQQ